LRTGVALTGATAAVVAAVALSYHADVAASLGTWLSVTDPFAANAALGLTLAAPVLLATLALLRHRSGVAARRELARRLRHDALTGLPNRNALDAALDRVVQTTRDGMHLAAALYLDLDRFKQVNDSYGHAVGDDLMVAVARTISGEIGPGCMAIRHGGDEFIVLVGSLLTAVEAEQLAQRLVQAIERPYELGPDTVRISVSIGVAVCDRGGVGATDLLDDADVAMYAAKATGPGSVCVFEPAMRARLSRANAAPRLRAAIDNDELELGYVPIVSVATGELAAVRAELWWDGTGRSPISGRELTDALDDTGLIVVARNRALRDACTQLQRWRKARHGAVTPQLAIAVSPRQLAQASFRDHVAAAVSDLGIAPGQLCVVVGDRALAHEITDAWTMLRHLRALGVQVAIEGFGSGTSSLADIREARVDQIWLHPQLVRGLLPGSEDEAIVEHVIGLGHKLGIIVVADQVETATQAAILRRLGCDRLTGPLIGADLAPAEIAKLMVPAAAPTRLPPVEVEPDLESAARPPKLRSIR
jgi:diguanylate cyclase (GGDEF)-like protein